MNQRTLGIKVCTTAGKAHTGVGRVRMPLGVGHERLHGGGGHVRLWWEAPQPNKAYKPNSLENSNIKKLWALNQQLSKILLVVVVIVPYIQFIAPMMFCVLSTLINS